MPVTFPAKIGSAKSNSSSNTLVVPFTTPPPIGTHCVMFGTLRAAQTISSISDGVNVWQVNVNNNTSSIWIFVASCRIQGNMTGLSATLTLSANVTNKFAQMQRMDGAHPTNWFIANSTPRNGSGTTRTNNTVAPEKIGDGITGFFVSDEAETAFAAAATYTVLPQTSGTYESITSPTGSMEGVWKTATATGNHSANSSGASANNIYGAVACAWRERPVSGFFGLM